MFYKVILFNTSSDFFFQPEACIMYCFHAEFAFDFVLVILIVVYTPRVYLNVVKVKLTFTCFSFGTSDCFAIESVHAFYFANNVVV